MGGRLLVVYLSLVSPAEVLPIKCITPQRFLAGGSTTCSEENMLLRVLVATLLMSAAAMAGSKPVCPGPAAFGSARCHSHVTTDKNGSPNATSLPAGYGPVQFQTAYGLPSSTAGAGVTIGIVDAYDDPNIESDLGVYSSTYGLLACTTANGCFKKVNQTGGTTYPAKNAGWALEISLDVEIAHAVCPNCKILLVEANSNQFADLNAAEDYAAAHADIVSNSWGGSESSGETSYDIHFNHIGTPITFSSGDSGYGVEYPAASQYVTAVGGTTLTLNTNNTRKNETVWSGAGSGCSAYEPKPSWQTDNGCIRRTVVDVAADADPNTGAAVYDTVRYQGRSGWFKVGGTSLASPIIASVYALAGNAASTVDGSFPYSNISGLFDVKSGSNGSCGGTYLCTGVVGYDGPTGNGTPNGTAAF
jgi:subtilase family serine protease